MSRLHRRVVAVTREGDPDDPLASGLREEGAHVVDWPTLSFEPRDDVEFRDAVDRIDEFDWVVFTSARAVQPVVNALGRVPAVPVAAVGRATADALTRLGWRVSVVGGGGSEKLVDTLVLDGPLSGARVLFPAGSKADDTLECGLNALNADVRRVEAYRAVESPPDSAAVLRDLARGVDAVTFTSPSAIQSLSRALADEWPQVLTGCSAVTIGETTAGAARARGLAPVWVASQPSIQSIVETCAALFHER